MATILLKEAGQSRKQNHGDRALQLSKYITNDEKCTAIRAYNVLTPIKNAEEAALEIASYCDLVDQTGTRKLIPHWIMSWKTENGEPAPTPEEMLKAGKEAWDGLGYANCPVIMAIHTNTDNPHIHFVGSRVDSINETVIKDSFTHVRAQKIVAEIAHAHGWHTENGNWYAVKDGEIVPNTRKGKRGGVRSKARAKEELTGLKSEERILSEALQKFCDENRQFFQNWKWADLHTALAQIGIEMQYTEHNGRGGLAFSQDGRNWEKGSITCPELSYPNISQSLGTKNGTYRKARAKTLETLAEARKRLKIEPEPLLKGEKNGHFQQQQKSGHGSQNRNTGNGEQEIKRRNGIIDRINTQPSSDLHVQSPTERNGARNTGDSRTSLEKNRQGRNATEADRTRQENQYVPKPNNGISKRDNETPRLTPIDDPKPDARRDSSTKPSTIESERRTGRNSLFSIGFKQTSDEEYDRFEQSRNDAQRRSEESWNHGFNEYQKKIRALIEKTKTRLIQLAEKTTLDYLKSESLKSKLFQKFKELEEKSRQMQYFYDTEFIKQTQTRQEQAGQNHYQHMGY